MDSDSEKLCMEEIDHLVLDNDKKVTVAYISNTWNIPNKDGEVILEKWLKNYTDDRSIVKEYLIRGNDTNGNAIITVIPEKSLAKVEKICPKFTKTLYSIEIGSINGKSLNVHEPAANKFISLKLNSNPRNVKVHEIVVPQAEKSIKKESEPPKKTNLFGVAASKQAEKKEVKTVKNESGSSKEAKVKEEKTSPKKQSPKKNQPPSKAQSSKSIASFFGSKPSSSKSNATKADKSVSEATSKIESVTIKDEPVEETSSGTKNTQKRFHSNTSDSNEDAKSAEKKQTKKKMKLEPKSHRSRVMQLCDSSSDEESTTNGKDSQDEPMDTEEEVVVKKEKENKTPSPEKMTSNKVNGSSSGKRRAKVKKTVTRTYEDEDGFINTVRETEEVSCSDEEPEVAPPPPKKAATITDNGSSSTATKKKISPPAGKKQGSILSFFGKK
ncbi:uncharacterized protein LOC129569757 [Sitodiplosis mosellana]|uniref:uncharacterized protein LOC129569757 n=1 Tax=Sitodiplosis mosellana TaxID=263140 RepID=UPI0024437B04|nr:uncharacterized protein LOC129569757 [Sitodiplosis mosellana]